MNAVKTLPQPCVSRTKTVYIGYILKSSEVNSFPKQKAQDEGLLHSGGLAVLANSEPVSVSGHSRILCGGLRLRNHGAVAENYNLITRFSDFACLVAVCLCCSSVVHCQRGVH